MAKRTGDIELTGGIISASGASAGLPGDDIVIAAGAGNTTGDGGDIVLTPGSSASGSVGAIVISPVGTPTVTTNKLWNDGGNLTWNGNDISSGGGGDVTKVGTPAINQLAYWTGDGTIAGTPELTFAAGTSKVLTLGASGGVLIDNTNGDFSIEDNNGVPPIGNPKVNLNHSGGTKGQMGYLSTFDLSIRNLIGQITLDAASSTGTEAVEISRGGLIFNERVDHAVTPSTGRGELWLRNDSPNVLVFTNDSGVDTVLGSGGGSGLFSEDGNQNIIGGTNAGANLGVGAFDNFLAGVNAGDALTTGDNNIAIGTDALSTADGDNNNTAIGVSALELVNAGVATNSVAVGNSSLANASTGVRNTAIGFQSGNALTSGFDNVFVGETAGVGVVTGSSNVFIGNDSGTNMTLSSTGNVIIGSNAGPVTVGDTDNQLFIHNTTTDTPLIGGDFTTGRVTLNGSVRFTERADHIGTPTATFGEIWVRNDAPNNLIFTDDAGTDWVLNTAGGGDVSKVGTPVNNQIGVWTGDGTIEGDANLTWDGTILTVSDTVGHVQISSNQAEMLRLNDPSGSDARLVFQSLGAVNARVRLNGSALRMESINGLVELSPGLGSGQQTVEILQGGLMFNERADHSATPVAGNGELWVRNDTPNALIFTDDAGTDHDLTASSGVTGTGTNNYFAIWDGTTGLKADTLLLQSGAGFDNIFGTSIISIRNASDVSHVLVSNNGVTMQANSANGLFVDGSTGQVRNYLTVQADDGITMAGGILFDERADHQNIPAAAKGELWVRNDTPNVLVFTDDAGTDTVLGAGGGGISNVVEDTTPQLGGDLDVNGNSIVSVTNGDINIVPNGTGKTAITNIEAPLTINTQTGTTYGPVLADAEKMITLDNASAITVTIPANASVAYPVGTKLNFMQLGAGAVTIGITTDTLNVESTLTTTLGGQYAVATAFKVTSTSWVLFGNLAAV